jgi:aspartyl-tRNA(Asn)/glutamyl-tRNA(Gln) amidotransferase subunit A
MTILEAARLQSEGKLSSMDLTRRSLDRIHSKNAELNAFVTVLDEAALARAAQLDGERAQGRVRGPLHGIPVAVKDVFCTKGVRTMCGSKLFASHVPGHDAAVVERLNEAGAVIVGKTAMHELAYGVTSNNPHFGAVRNPWDTSRIPGGSSGGSGSAVGAGLVFMAMGSDTGGSIRIPAAFCGTAGIKPTTGRVSRFGVMPLDYTLDHMGPLTMTVRDAAACLQALAGPDPRDDSSSQAPVDDYLAACDRDIRGLRVGLPENFYFDRVFPEIETAVRRLAAKAESLGAIVTPVEVPDIAAINAIGRVILLSEASATFESHLWDRSQFGADVLALLDQGRLIAATDYVNAQRLRRVFQAEFARLWDSVDCVLTPTTPNLPALIGEAEVDVGGVKEDTRLASTRFVRGINVLGLPAVAIPCGLSASRLPMSAQIIGRAFDEATVFRAGAALEEPLPPRD